MFTEAGLKSFAASAFSSTAFAINGQTLHKLLHIPMYVGYFEKLAKRLKPSQKLTDEFAGCKLLIVDKVRENTSLYFTDAIFKL